MLKRAINILFLGATFLLILIGTGLAQSAPDFYGMALTALDRGQKEEAAELIRKAQETDPLNIGYQKHLGWLLYDLEKYEEAEVLFRQILQNWPDDYDALKGLTHSYLRSKSKTVHIPELETYVHRHTQNMDAALLLAHVYSNSPETRSKAIDIFERVLDSGSANREARKGLALAYSRNGLYEEAIRNYQALLLSDSDDLETRLELARAYSWNKQHMESLEQYRKLLKEDSQRFLYRHEYARVLAWSGSYKESLREYRELLITNSQSSDLRLEYAETLSWSAKLDESIQEFERILETDPDSQRAKLGLARAYHWKGAQYTAERIYEEILSAYPEDIDAMIELAEAQSWSNRVGKAKNSYEKAFEIDPDHGEVKEGLKKIEQKIATSLSPRIGYYKDSGSFERLSAGLAGSYHITPDTPIEVGFIRTRFEQDREAIYRSSTSIRGSHRFTDRFVATAGYTFHDYGGDDKSSNSFLVAGTAMLGDYTTIMGQVGRLDIVDTLTGEDMGIGTFQYLGNGGTDIDAVRQAIHSTDYSAILTHRLTSRLNATAIVTFGDVSKPSGQGKESRDLNLSYSVLYGEEKQFNILYNYYFLGFDEETPLYFSPNSFENHSLIFQWRHQPTERFGYGIDLSPIYQPGGDLFGGSAVGFAEFDLADSLSLYMYGAYLNTDLFGDDEDEFHSRVFVVSFSYRF